MAARGQGKKYQGSKWITRQRRLAIYMRDGMACCYCGAGIEDGAMLTLDHVKPHCQGGNGNNENLITACRKCNSSRGDRDIEVFTAKVAEYIDHGATAQAILDHINDCLARPVDQKAAKAMIERRGSYANAMSGN